VTDKYDRLEQAATSTQSILQLYPPNFPTVRNLGIYNNRLVAGTNSPSHHAEGHALDRPGPLSVAAERKWLGDELFKIFVGSTNP
jgi:hypothetical protein